MTTILLERPIDQRETPDNQEVFQGGLDICVAPPFNPAHIIKLTRLLTSNGIKIRQTSGSSKDGCTFTVSLEKPLSLIFILHKLEEVINAHVTQRQQQSSTALEWESTAFLLGERIDFTKITVELDYECSIESPKQAAGQETAEVKANPDRSEKSWKFYTKAVQNELWRSLK